MRVLRIKASRLTSHTSRRAREILRREQEETEEYIRTTFKAAKRNHATIKMARILDYSNHLM